jgi:transposase
MELVLGKESPQVNYVPLLQAMVEGLQDEVSRLKKELHALRAENALLRKRVEELQAGLRGRPLPPPILPSFIKPAIPRNKNPGRPGRKPGHPVALRPMPPKIDWTVDVPLAGERGRTCHCPDCQGELTDFQSHERLVEDIIPAKRVTTRYKTRSGFCVKCRRRVESRSPEQPPAGLRGEQPHAQLGLNTLAWAAVLRVVNRLPLRQVATVIGQSSGLSVSAGALTKQAKRLAGWMQAEYELIKLSLRASDVVYCDETGARIKGDNAWLWGLTSTQHTLYHFDQSRAGKVVRELLGEAFGGHLVSDFLSAYTRLPYKQQKCLVHLLRELRETAVKNPAFAAGSFRRRLRRVLKEMLLLKAGRREMLVKRYANIASRLKKRLELIGQTGKTSVDADEKRIGKRVIKFREQLTAFLDKQNLEGTNNPAERAMIHAVVARKISGGHRSWSGARAWAVLASIARTAWKQGRDVLESVKQVILAAWAGHSPGVLAATPGPSP